jgi:hypothetical protein
MFPIDNIVLYNMRQVFGNLTSLALKSYNNHSNYPKDAPTETVADFVDVLTGNPRLEHLSLDLALPWMLGRRLAESLVAANLPSLKAIILVDVPFALPEAVQLLNHDSSLRSASFRYCEFCFPHDTWDEEPTDQEFTEQLRRRLKEGCRKVEEIDVEGCQLTDAADVWL